MLGEALLSMLEVGLVGCWTENMWWAFNWASNMSLACSRISKLWAWTYPVEVFLVVWAGYFFFNIVFCCSFCYERVNELPLSLWFFCLFRTTYCLSFNTFPDLGADGIMGAAFPLSIKLMLFWFPCEIYEMIYAPPTESFFILSLLVLTCYIVPPAAFAVEGGWTLVVYICCIMFRMLSSESLIYCTFWLLWYASSTLIPLWLSMLLAFLWTYFPELYAPFCYCCYCYWIFALIDLRLSSISAYSLGLYSPPFMPLWFIYLWMLVCSWPTFYALLEY